MRVRVRLWSVVVIVWLVSLVAVGRLTYAQAQAPANPANMVTGSDIGFVVEGEKDGRVSGRWMIRVKGQWLPVGGGGLFPAK
jgi:hypothetical protein